MLKKQLEILAFVAFLIRLSISCGCFNYFGNHPINQDVVSSIYGKVCGSPHLACDLPAKQAPRIITLQKSRLAWKASLIFAHVQGVV